MPHMKVEKSILTLAGFRVLNGLSARGLSASSALKSEPALVHRLSPLRHGVSAGNSFLCSLRSIEAIAVVRGCGANATSRSIGIHVDATSCCRRLRRAVHPLARCLPTFTPGPSLSAPSALPLLPLCSTFSLICEKLRRSPSCLWQHACALTHSPTHNFDTTLKHNFS